MKELKSSGAFFRITNWIFHGSMDQKGDGNGTFLEIIRSRLVESGGLNKVKSELRAMVLNDVRDGDKSQLNSLGSKDSTSPTQIANHLVLEYLEWIGFQYSKDIFMTESGCKHLEPREFVESNTKVKNEAVDKELPLLLSMTMNLMNEPKK